MVWTITRPAGSINNGLTHTHEYKVWTITRPAGSINRRRSDSTFAPSLDYHPSSRVNKPRRARRPRKKGLDYHPSSRVNKLRTAHRRRVRGLDYHPSSRVNKPTPHTTLFRLAFLPFSSLRRGRCSSPRSCLDRAPRRSPRISIPPLRPVPGSDSRTPSMFWKCRPGPPQ